MASSSFGGHTRTSNTLKQSFDLRCTSRERLLPEFIAGILDEFDEGDEKTPWVRTMNNKTLEQDTGDLFADQLILGLEEEVEEHAGEVVGLVVGEAEMVSDGVDGVITSLRFDGGCVGGRGGGGGGGGGGRVDGAIDQAFENIHGGVVLELRESTLELGNTPLPDVVDEGVDERNIVFGAGFDFNFLFVDFLVFGGEDDRAQNDFLEGERRGEMTVVKVLFEREEELGTSHGSEESGREIRE